MQSFLNRMRMLPVCGETVIQSDRPNKKIFSITESGKKEFMNCLDEGAEENATQFKSAFMMKVFFGGNMPPAQSADMLRKFKADCEAYLEKMASTPESIKHYGSSKELYQTMYWQFTVDFGCRFIKITSDRDIFHARFPVFPKPPSLPPLSFQGFLPDSGWTA